MAHKHYYVVAVDAGGKVLGYYDGLIINHRKYAAIIKTATQAEKIAVTFANRFANKSRQFAVLVEDGEKTTPKPRAKNPTARKPRRPKA